MKLTVNQELHGYSIDVTVSCITAAPDPARDYWSEPGRNIVQRCTIIQSFTNKLISGLSQKYNLMITQCQMVLCNGGDAVTCKSWRRLLSYQQSKLDGSLSLYFISEPT